MKTFDEDKDLKSLLKSVKLESPNSDFSVKVMNRIFAENSLLEKIKNERILGKGFWIIFILFAALFATMIIFYSSGATSGGGLSDFISETNNDGITQDYRNFFQNIGTIPLSISGILIASSILVFIERFLNLKVKTFSK